MKATKQLAAVVLASIADAKGQPSLRPPGAAFINKPDAAALLAHDVDDVIGTLNRDELNDGVVAEAKLVDVISEEVKVVLIAVLVGVTNIPGAPIL